MFKRKVRKLIRNPKLFLSDMMIKRRHSIDALKPKKIEGHYKYTIVSAVYNVGRYLDEYIESVTKQHLDFESIYILFWWMTALLIILQRLSRDGSKENTLTISNIFIKKWRSGISSQPWHATCQDRVGDLRRSRWYFRPGLFSSDRYFCSQAKTNNIAMLCNNFYFLLWWSRRVQRYTST